MAERIKYGSLEANAGAPPPQAPVPLLHVSCVAREWPVPSGDPPCAASACAPEVLTEAAIRARALPSGVAGGKTANTLASGKGGATTIVPMSEETLKAKQKHDEMLRKFHIEMRARTIAAPTHDKDVKLQLRCLECGLAPLCCTW